MTSLTYLLKDFITKRTKKDSYDAHNSEFIKEGKLEREREMHNMYEDTNLFNHEALRFQDIINLHKWINIAIDIWSWSWFFSSKLASSFHTVYAIEPSSTGTEIAKEIIKNENIIWINWFAEKVLKDIVSKYDEPIFFLTSTVLSHLEDSTVIEICKGVNAASVGSVLAFSEVFGATKHKHLWHIRTQKWWQEQLPGWEIDFFGPRVVYSTFGATCYKGFSGKKIK